MSTKLLCRWLSSFCWTLKYRWENSGATQKQQMRRIFRPSLSPTKALANSRFVRLKLRASSVRPSFVGLCSATIWSQKSKMYVYCVYPLLKSGAIFFHSLRLLFERKSKFFDVLFLPLAFYVYHEIDIFFWIPQTVETHFIIHPATTKFSIRLLVQNITLSPTEKTKVSEFLRRWCQRQIPLRFWLNSPWKSRQTPTVATGIFWM